MLSVQSGAFLRLAAPAFYHFNNFPSDRLMMSLFGLNHTSSGGLFTCEQIRHFWIRSPCDYRLITSHKHTWRWNWKHFLISGCTRQSLALLHSSYLLFFARSPIVGSEKQENYFPSPIKVARVSLKRQKIHENRKKVLGKNAFLEATSIHLHMNWKRLCKNKKECKTRSTFIHSAF